MRITRRDGWAVLNADDPRVWEMRRRTRANLYAFSLDPDGAGGAEAGWTRGGRAAVAGATACSCCAVPGDSRGASSPWPSLPVTFGGLSALQRGQRPGRGRGLRRAGPVGRQIASGPALPSRWTRRANPGRLNLYERRGVLALVDFAHNEAGLRACWTCRAGASPGRRGKVRLALRNGGRPDRRDPRIGWASWRRGADDLVIAEKRHYLRGRDLAEMNAILRAGRAGGRLSRARIEAHPSELAALQALVARAERGDVCAVMAHVERSEICSTGWSARATGRFARPSARGSIRPRRAAEARPRAGVVAPRSR